MEKDYRHIWSEKRSLINVESHIRQYTEQRDILGSTHDTSFIYAENGVAEEFHRDIDNKKWIEQGEKFLSKDFFESILEQGKQLRDKFALFLHSINDNLTTLSNKQLAELFQESCRFHSRLRGLFKTSRPEFFAAAEEKLKQKINIMGNSEAAFETLTTPTVFDDVMQEAADWFELVSKNDQNSIPSHIAKYPWLVAHTYDENEIMIQMNERFSTDSSRLVGLQKKVEGMGEEKAQLKERQQKLLDSLNDDEVMYLSFLFQEASLERMRLKGSWAGSDYLYQNLYVEISKRTNIPLKQLYSSYRIDEVLGALQTNGPTLSSEQIAERKEAYVLWLQNGEIKFKSGEEAKKIIKEELQHLKVKQDSTLKGQTASMGSAQGNVRVVIPGDIGMLHNAIQEFQEGDILVTTMTQPNMVPLMEKAAAIVTNEGGMTSHAAIIAREFKTPCIVGTEIATKVFKDGELVEVDADNGIVRKIK